MNIFESHLLIPFCFTASVECMSTGWDRSVDCAVQESTACPSLVYPHGSLVCKDSDMKIVSTMSNRVTCELDCGSGYQLMGESTVNIV